MSLVKVTYTDHQTVITAQNLNDIQNEIINKCVTVDSKSFTTSQKAQARTNIGINSGTFFTASEGIPGNGSVSITVPNGFRGILCVPRGSSNMCLYIVNVSSGGAVNICDVVAATQITYTTSTNTITFSNSSSSTAQIFYIGNDVIS